ncbi:TolC family protein [Accumulibacter sp.]|uniref:TolC family protein n=1 Tax=Accumulibacter sp. TaxID=2053492 RepID=UPI0025DD20FC|nr:TolC family protein [Accumulibacter sp.]MCM8611985.1 TolC family protein [Accumulibacter sp.]MCM8635845.1 TolC family protein [Accumulibacter sp.]MCM8641929.1 TolC family protein [Accumulibacter sp.]
MHDTRSTQSRLFTAILFVTASLSGPPAAAETPTMGQAFAAAWERHPTARTAAARHDEFAARRDAADSVLSGAPTATLSNRNDRLQRDAGQSEWEAGIALPLWLPGYQERTLALLGREQSAYATLLELARWQLAGEVRERWWQAMLAAHERAVAEARSDAARQLANDVERRVRAGEVPRMDANQARATAAAAAAVVAEADGRAHRAERSFLALTGLPLLPDPGGMNEQRRLAPATAHPQLAALEAAIATARARLEVAARNSRDLPEILLGMRRERPVADADWQNSTIVGVRIPLASDTRNRPRVATANAELVEAEALLFYERQRVEAERDTAERELQRADEAIALAETRRTLAVEMRREYARAFALGQIDLPQRLRVEADAFAAELAAARARLEGARAVSRYNQAIGVLP